RIPENEVIRVFYGEGDAKPFDRSISRMRWLHDKIGTLGFAFQAEDNGYIRQFIFALRGAGMLATLDSPGSEHFTESGSDLGKMAWGRSSFHEPPSIRCLVKNQNSIEPKDLKMSGEFLVLPSESIKIDHFNDDLIAQWKLGKVENRTFKGADDRDVQMF